LATIYFLSPSESLNGASVEHVKDTLQGLSYGGCDEVENIGGRIGLAFPSIFFFTAAFSENKELD